MKKYGVENPSQNDEIKNKKIETCLKNNGVEHPSQNQEIQNKQKQTCLEKYGTNCPFQNEEVKNKIKQTFLKNYGVEHHSQNEDIKKQKIETSLKNYGVEHPSQNKEIMDKQSKNAYLLKEYILPSGKTIKYQGYEKFALDELIKNQNIPEEDLITGCKNVPTIWYEDENKKKHRHYVDIFIPSQNKCIEVKSNWTAKNKKDCIFLKQTAGKELGYEYEIWIYNAKGERVECHE